MQQFKHMIKSPEGLHARPAMGLMQKAKAYKSSVTVKYNRKTANAKNVFHLFNLAAGKGAEIIIEIEGIDEVEAYKAIKKYCDGNI